MILSCHDSVGPLFNSAAHSPGQAQRRPGKNPNNTPLVSACFGEEHGEFGALIHLA